MEQTDKERIKAQAKNHINVGDGYNELWETGWIAGATSEHETQVIPLREQLKDMTQMQDDLIKAWDQEKANKQVYIDQLNGSTTTILELRERLEKVEKEDEKQNEMWESVIDYLFTGTNATPKDSWKRIVQEDYILLKRPSPPTDQTECERCNGTGLVGMTIRTDNGDFDADDQPCPDCKPLKP